jgi:hypothetical protein
MNRTAKRNAAKPAAQKTANAVDGRRSGEDMLQELRRRFFEINDLEAAADLLRWDQATYMPGGGARARGRQSATLRRLAHERLVDPAIGRDRRDLINRGFRATAWKRQRRRWANWVPLVKSFNLKQK